MSRISYDSFAFSGVIKTQPENYRVPKSLSHWWSNISKIVHPDQKQDQKWRV